MRGLVVSVLSLALVGCVEFPSPLSVVSFAASGVSLVTTGKTIGDHMLTVVQQQDCAVYRILQNKPMCQPFDGEVPAVVALLDRETYYSDGFDVDGPPYSEVGTVVSPQVSPPVSAIRFASVSEPVTAEPLAAIQPAAGRSGIQLSDFRPAVARSNHASIKRGRAAIAARSAGAIDPNMLAADLTSYVMVIGSHTGRARAEAQAGQYNSLRPRILPTLESGKRRHHVVLGPFANSELNTAWAALAHYGIEDAWLVRVRKEWG